MSRARLVTLLALAVALAALPPAAARGQAGRGWTVVQRPAADLWFDALAGAALAPASALPYYHGGAAALRLRPPRALRERLAADSAFEVLHFVPLYLDASEPTALLAALDAAAGGGRAPTADAAFGVRALQAVLPRAAQRATLAELSAHVSATWRGGSEPAAAVRAAAPWRALLQRAWDTRFAPALAPWLRAERLDGGTLLVSPALGAEGRMFAGDPRDPTDNVVAVALDATGGDSLAPLHLAVRELCFPLVGRVVAATPAYATLGGAAGELVTARAAVRCGALLLERADPALAAGYRRVFAAADSAALARRYPVDPALLDALSRAAQRALGDPATTRHAASRAAPNGG